MFVKIKRRCHSDYLISRRSFLLLVSLLATLFTVTTIRTNNDPSAGSPTETLLRLLLPLNDQV